MTTDTQAAIIDASLRVPQTLSVRLADPAGVPSAAVQPLILTAVLRVLPQRRLSGLAKLGDSEVFVKIFYGKAARRYWRREIAGAERLVTAHAASPTLLAIGSLADSSGWLVVYTALPQPVAIRSDRVADMRAGVELLAQLHRAGCIHTDVHVDNFQNSGGRCWMVDADGIRVARGRRAQLDNLGTFLAQRPPIYDSEIETLWRAYEWARGDEVTTTPAQLQLLTAQQRRRRVRRYLRKTQRNCTEFVHQRSHGRNVLCDRAHWPVLQSFLEQPELYLAGGQALKQGRSATVVRVSIEGRSYIVKRYNLKSWVHRVRRWFKPRARRAWRNGHHLAFVGVSTAKPIALLEHKWGWARGVCYLVMPDVGTQDLARALAEAPQDFERYAPGTLAVLRALQAAGLQHGDLKATNFVLADDRVVLIDYDALRSGPSEPDWQRFLANWSAQPRLLQRWQAELAAHANKGMPG